MPPGAARSSWRRAFVAGPGHVFPVRNDPVTKYLCHVPCSPLPVWRLYFALHNDKLIGHPTVRGMLHIIVAHVSVYKTMFCNIARLDRAGLWPWPTRRCIT
ncbi:hypothetical protein EMIT0111MI5_150001 [Burkholderia sp. IT-111MI5]